VKGQTGCVKKVKIFRSSVYSVVLKIKLLNAGHKNSITLEAFCNSCGFLARPSMFRKFLGG